MIRADFRQDMEFHYYAATGSLCMQQPCYCTLFSWPEHARGVLFSVSEFI